MFLRFVNIIRALGGKKVEAEGLSPSSYDRLRTGSYSSLVEGEDVLAAESEDLSKVIDFRKVGALHKAVIGEVNPGFAI
jgi:hypothetical protein